MYTQALLGGTFNPPHMGHLRLSIEIREALGLNSVALLPCNIPPHKNPQDILDFSLRCKMLQAMTEAFDWITINTIEGTRQGPSYTLETLRALATKQRTRLLFVMGAGDFIVLPSWHKGVEIPDAADILVVSRDNNTEKKFLTAVHQWPGPPLQQMQPKHPAIQYAFHTPQGGAILFLPIPILEVSASLIRQRWLQSRLLAGLLPQVVQELLEYHAPEVQMAWSPTDSRT